VPPLLSDDASDRALAKDDVPDVSAFQSPTSFLRGFVSRAGANLDTLRLRFPAVCASPVNAADAGEGSFFAALDAIDGPCFDSTLVITSGGFGSPSTISDGLYGEALTAATILRAIHSWLLHPGSLNFQGLPSDPRGKVGRGYQLKRLHRRRMCFAASRPTRT
jgi:hypothetical protein